MNAKVQTRFVTQIEGFVSMVKDLYLNFALTLRDECLGCNSDSDCEGPNQICDPYGRCKTNCTVLNDCKWTEMCDDDNKICTPKCSEDDDCKGEVCDEAKGICVPGNN